MTRPSLLHRRSKSNTSQSSQQPSSLEMVFQVPPHDPPPHAPTDSRVSSESHRPPPPPLRLVIPEQQVAGPYPGIRQELPYYPATLEHGYDLAGQNIVIDTSAIFVVSRFEVWVYPRYVLTSASFSPGRLGQATRQSSDFG